MDSQPPRVVFDCNVYVQAVANRNSPARKALRLFLEGKATLFVSDAILREVRDVLSRPELRRKLPAINDRIVNALFAKLEAEAVPIINVPEEFHYERDPDDEIYLNLAIVTNAAYLVSKDNDLLDLMTTANDVAREFRRRFPFLRILKAEDFVKEIARKRN